MRSDNHAAMWCLSAMLFAGAVAMCTPSARGHDIYHHWRVPNNNQVSCCDNTDCRPTRAYMHDDGLWRAWNGYLWLTVPSERVLPTDYAGDGRSHLCEKGTFIYCFTPGEPRG